MNSGGDEPQTQGKTETDTTTTTATNINSSTNSSIQAIVSPQLDQPNNGAVKETPLPDNSENDSQILPHMDIEVIAAQADDLVQKTYELLPNGSLFVVFTGNGDLHEIKRYIHFRAQINPGQVATTKERQAKQRPVEDQR